MENLILVKKDLFYNKSTQLYKLKSTIISLCIFLFAFVFYSLTHSYSTNNTHPVLTEESAIFFNGQNGNYKLSQEEIEWLKTGSIREDEPLRYINHFYDPVHKTGWSGKHFGSLSQEEGYKIGSEGAPKPPIASIDWAVNQEYQAAYGRQYGNQTWQKAIKSYIDGDKKSAFLALGHILHLVQDLSVPDHTRDDTHAGIYGDPGSPYEDYAKRYTNFNKLTIANDLLNQNQKLINFQDLSEAFNYLANYSNNNFFSEDTISDEEFERPQIDLLENKKISINGMQILFLYDKNQDIYLAFLNDKNQYSTKDDSLVLPSYRVHLFPQAVLVSASVIDLFFKEVEKYKDQPDLLDPIISDSNQSLLQTLKSSPKIITLKTADWVDNVLVSGQVLVFNAVNFVVNETQKLFTSVIDILSKNLKNQAAILINQSITSEMQSNNGGLSIDTGEKENNRGKEENIIKQELPTSNPQKNNQLSSPSPKNSNPRSNSQDSSSTLSIFENPQPPYPGFGGGTVVLKTNIEDQINENGNNSSSSSSPSSSSTSTSPDSLSSISPPPPDTTPPDISLTILECQNSLAENGCLLNSTTSLHILWNSSSDDLEYFEFTFNDLVSTTTSTSTEILPPDNSKNTISLRAKDKNGNWSPPLTQVVEISLMPVVINEVAWAGTGPNNSSDEWIELYNRTDYDISLNNWVLYSQTDNTPYINLSGKILSKGYYLLERTSDNTVSDIPADKIYTGSLNNDGEILVLSYASSTIDETTLCGLGPVRWCPGYDYKYRTMERVDPNVSGTDPLNWGANVYPTIIINGKDADGNPILGTPKARNSVNYLILKGAPGIYEDVFLTKSNSPYVVNNQIQTFYGTSTLKIEPGVVIKFSNDAGFYFVDNSKIISQGTKQEPIVFTGFNDDEYGGDLDGVSNSTSSSGLWYGVKIKSSNSEVSVFDNTIFRYGGKWYNPSIWQRANLSIENARAEITNCVFEDSINYGLRLINSDSTVSQSIFNKNNQGNDPSNINSGLYISGGSPTISQNTFSLNKVGLFVENSSAVIKDNLFQSNSNLAIASSGRLPVFINNSGSDNGLNIINLNGYLTNLGDVLGLKPNPLPYSFTGYEDSYVVSSSTLVIEKGVVVKGGNRLNVSGNLIIDGESPDDIVFTSLSDDSLAGDSNGDGNLSQPVPGDFKGIYIYPTGSLSAKGFTIKYAGSQGYGGSEAAGITVSGGLANIFDATFSSNYPYGLYAALSPNIKIENAKFENHNFNGPWGQKSAMAIFNSNVILNNILFKDNFLGILSDTISTFFPSAVEFINNTATTSPALW